MTLRVNVDIERDLLDLAAYQADADAMNNVTDDVTINIATPELKVIVSPPSIVGGLRSVVEDVIKNAGAGASVKGIADAILARAQDTARLIDGFSESKPLAIAFTVETDNNNGAERCYQGVITFTGLIDRTHPTLFEWEPNSGLLRWNHKMQVVSHLPAGTTGNQRVLQATAGVAFRSRSKDLFFQSILNFHLQFRGLKNAASASDIATFVASNQSSFIQIPKSTCGGSGAKGTRGPARGSFLGRAGTVERDAYSARRISDRGSTADRAGGSRHNPTCDAA